MGRDRQRDAVLEKMEAMQVDTLPVVSEDNRFVGVVDRGRIILFSLEQRGEEPIGSVRSSHS